MAVFDYLKNFCVCSRSYVLFRLTLVVLMWGRVGVGIKYSRPIFVTMTLEPPKIKQYAFVTFLK